ncbi:hypothetical protein HanXRQr2_Chr13g0584161 [Helianthus annuus]|uniref:Uncharacterized protein n=1 Tax=Helianthus annuus TaxID=4232 RepID=A0A251SQT7_HELAN|nr:hypothetical protein HanXRQr2_Chr13g0584161 [Helianthus annuus]KAJ0848859.1 hypothetical protein HanPSC8_Chr13g0562381 [Helianthus annuus]
MMLEHGPHCITSFLAAYGLNFPKCLEIGFIFLGPHVLLLSESSFIWCLKLPPTTMSLNSITCLLQFYL